MKIRNCPRCFGDGRSGHAGRCSFCHGKRKVSSEFVKWDNEREDAYGDITDYWEKQKQVRIEEGIKGWEIDNPKPRKFAKKKK